MEEDQDFYGGDDEGDDISPLKDESVKIKSSLYQAGFRDGKAKEEEKLFQVNFDEGFADGMLLGRKIGELWAEIQQSLLSMKNLPLRVVPEEEQQMLDLKSKQTLVILMKVLPERLKEGNCESTLHELEQILKEFPVPVLLTLNELKETITTKFLLNNLCKHLG